jgi:hypothetical protein
MRKMTAWPETWAVELVVDAAEPCIDVAIVGGERLPGSVVLPGFVGSWPSVEIARPDEENKLMPEVVIWIGSKDSVASRAVDGGTAVDRFVKYGGSIPRVVGKFGAVGKTGTAVSACTGAR